jgi:hypothetical protein
MKDSELTNTNQPEDDPKYSCRGVIIHEEDDRRVDDIDQQTDAEHNSQYDPWKEEVLIALDDGQYRKVSRMDV